MKVNRIEKHLIKRNNPMWKIIDEKCWFSKNVYNEATYIIRQEFFKTKKWERRWDLDKVLQQTDNYKLLGSQASQRTLFLVDKSWKSYFKAIKDWGKKKGKGYFGKPKMPYYKDKLKGRFILTIKNIQCRIEDEKLLFSWHPLKPFSGIPTNVKGKLMQVRFVPMGEGYMMEIVYETDVPEPKKQSNRIVGIDLGVNNFVAMANNIGEKSIIVKGGVIKSMNQYYNKERSEISRQTNMVWNNRMRRLTDKHLRKLDTYTHTVSKRLIEYCKINNIDTIVIGKTDGWKNESNLGHVNNQNFVCVPHDKFIKQMQYKAENEGIKCIITEEEYTSGTSFLDNELPIKDNYNIKRRIKRGLFKSDMGIKFNSDINAAYQIIKKVFPDAFKQGYRGCDLHPVGLAI